MKKNYLLFIILTVLSLSLSAQITLSQNESNTILEGTSACDSRSPDFITADNVYYRSFDLTNLGYSEFSVQEITFGVEKVENPSTNFAIELIVYGNSGADFPNGTLTEISRVSVPLDESDTNMLKTIPITATVDEDQMVVAISIPDEIEAGNMTSFYIGGNNLGESAPTYTYSASCGDTQPVTFESLGIFGQHLILNVTGNATLGNEEFNISLVSISPNPADNFLNIKLKEHDILESMDLFTIHGQQLMHIESSEASNRIDVSNLQSGIYILKMNTSRGTMSKRIGIK